jgi:hypothetical protein
MITIRNASIYPMTILLLGQEFRFVPQEEHEITSVQLASEDFQRVKEYFAVTEIPEITNIPEQKTQEVSDSDNEPVKPVKKAK